MPTGNWQLGIWKRCYIRRARSSFRVPRSAFTLIELMVVIAILVVVIGAVITVGRSVVARGKEKETEALLKKLELATEDYKLSKPLGKVGDSLQRYGNYPPDELDGFSGDPAVRIPGSSGSGHLAPRGSELILDGTQAGASAIKEKFKYGDIKAAVLGIRVFSEKGAAILDGIAPKYRRPADRGADGKPEFLDRNGNSTLDAGVDQPLDYFVDAWGTPIGYFAAKCDNCTPFTITPAQAAAWDQPPNVAMAADRLKTSVCLLDLNNSVPFFFSYGADGADQFDKAFGPPPEGSGEAKDLIRDYSETPVGKIDNRFNADNLYSPDGLRERIEKHSH